MSIQSREGPFEVDVNIGVVVHGVKEKVCCPSKHPSLTPSMAFKDLTLFRRVIVDMTPLAPFRTGQRKPKFPRSVTTSFGLEAFPSLLLVDVIALDVVDATTTDAMLLS